MNKEDKFYEILPGKNKIIHNITKKNILKYKWLFKQRSWNWKEGAVWFK